MRCTGNPDAISVSTYQAHWENEIRYYREYRGPRVDDSTPHKRFSRMLWLLTQDFLYIDPMYAMYRRRILAQTHLNRIMLASDTMLSAELSLLGPYCHVPRLLCHRRRVPGKSLLIHPPPGHPNLKFSAWQMFRVLTSMVRDAGLTGYPRVHALLAAFKFCARRQFQRQRSAIRASRRRLGLRRPKRMRRA